MVTIEKRWRRWSGPRSDLLRAARLAVAELRAFTGYESTAKVTVIERGDLTQTNNSLDTIEEIHRAELQHLKSIRVEIEPSRTDWEKAFRDAPDDKRPPIPREYVELTIARYGTFMTVKGDDRTRVQGLSQRIEAELTRSAKNKPFDRELFFILAVPLAVVLMLVFLAATHVLGLAHVNNKWETAEIVALVLGPVVAASFGFSGWWLFPTLEVLPEGGGSRYARMGRWFSGSATAVVLGVLGAYIYGWVNPS